MTCLYCATNVGTLGMLCFKHTKTPQTTKLKKEQNNYEDKIQYYSKTYNSTFVRIHSTKHNSTNKKLAMDSAV